MDQDTLTAIVASKRELDGMPVVSGASFGHTTPQFTFPIGGYGSLRAEEGTAWSRSKSTESSIRKFSS
jgi:muramoyltetrapeptide carboxypeptidase